MDTVDWKQCATSVAMGLTSTAAASWLWAGLHPLPQDDAFTVSTCDGNDPKNLHCCEAHQRLDPASITYCGRCTKIMARISSLVTACKVAQNFQRRPLAGARVDDLQQSWLKAALF